MEAGREGEGDGTREAFVTTWPSKDEARGEGGFTGHLVPRGSGPDWPLVSGVFWEFLLRLQVSSFSGLRGC